VNGVF
jgi:hypothetical protein